MRERNGHRLMALQFVSGSVAACGAVTVTNPFDMLKTRRQLHNELGLKGELARLEGPIRLTGVWQREGIRGLQRGLMPAYIYQVLMNGTRFTVYEPVRLALIRMTGSTNSNIPCNAAAGATAGCMAAYIGTPFNLIKTRLQSYSPHFSTGYQHGYGGMTQAIGRIWGEEGLRGLYRGVTAAMLRTTVGSAVQLSSYDWSKPLIASWTASSVDVFSVHLIAAMFSGVLACLAMNPFDVVMTRLYNQKSTAVLYQNFPDCALKTVRSEGVLALWKGLVPHFVRIGPHTVLTLVLLEQVRAFLRPHFVHNLTIPGKLEAKKAQNDG